MTPWMEEISKAVAVTTPALIAGWQLAKRAHPYTTKRVVSFFQRLDRAMTTVEHQLGPNGGGSLNDAIRRIDQRTLMTDARQTALIAAQPEAMFESDLAGAFTSANRAFEDLTGFSRAHLTGMEWVNAIHPEDRFRIVKAWQLARADHRAWIENCRLVTQHGRLLLVRIEAHPMRESIGDRRVVGWHGTVVVEDRG